MPPNPSIQNIVLDFDGTCTQIQVIHRAYLDRYLEELKARVAFKEPISRQDWQEAQDHVRANSPITGWTIATTPAAPAAADPYILAAESAKLLMRRQKITTDPPFEAHSVSSEAHEAPWRPEAKEVFLSLLNMKINILFISNTSSTKIEKRLLELLSVAELPAGMDVQSGANKFRICEPTLQQADEQPLPAKVRETFEKLSATHPVLVGGRPVYLRRAMYFDAIHKALKGDLSKLPVTLFCGDIWEMDLAMPETLGAQVHLIERAAPYLTYDYEREAVRSAKGRTSSDLKGLYDWFS